MANKTFLKGKGDNTEKHEELAPGQIVERKEFSYVESGGKTYTVIVTYIKITDEEARLKRAIIEGILKHSRTNNRS